MTTFRSGENRYHQHCDWCESEASVGLPNDRPWIAFKKAEWGYLQVGNRQWNFCPECASHLAQMVQDRQ